jgi:hypothetical protein
LQSFACLSFGLFSLLLLRFEILVFGEISMERTDYTPKIQKILLEMNTEIHGTITKHALRINEIVEEQQRYIASLEDQLKGVE